MTHQVYLSLGSNIGDRFNHLKQAQKQLAAHPAIEVLIASAYYQTSPVGGVEQDDFINQAMLIETSLSGNELLTYIHEIEAALHRVREVVWGPRSIDIDILFFDDVTSDDPFLILPHPEVYNRLFVLVPLVEIMADNFSHRDDVHHAITQLQAQNEQLIEKVSE